MTHTKDEALDLALEALEANQPVNYCVNSKGEKFPMFTKDPFKFERNAKAISAIKQARSAPVQEPVAWMDASGDIYKHELWPDWNSPHTPLYTTPPAAPVQEPLFWYKPYPNGMYNGPVHNAQIGDVLRGSEEWRPLYTTPPAAQPAPDLQAELEATNRQVEILSDALAESRREVAQLKAQPAPVHEPEIVQRVKRYAGQTLRTARNPNITARECIELANWLAANTTPPAAQRQWVGLTPHERMMCRSYDIDEAIANTEAKLKEKNNG